MAKAMKEGTWRSIKGLSGSKTQSALTEQIGGTHYKDMAIQPVEFCHKNGIGFIEGAVIKYVCRWNKSGGGGLKDIQKAKNFLEQLIEMEGKGPDAAA